ncbi:MAG: hypothetical protein LBH60_06385 [Prevotellaceae bacterium]|jgi:hypothetical protein|nr:hypothetical protein [Prevotellaceae bacterium]
MEKTGIRKFQMLLHIIAIALLASVSLTFLASCNDKDRSEENANDTQKNLTAKVTRDALRYVAIAVERSFDDMTKSAARSDYSIQPEVKEVNSSDFMSIYEYDAIKIINAVRFSAKECDIPVIRDTCGNGEIEVYTANFVLYVYGDGDNEPDEKRLIPILGDAIIIFKGEWGIYCCAQNSMSIKPNYPYEKMPGILGTHYIYSSHKHFEGKAFVKQFNYPIHSFYLDNRDSMYRVAALTDYDNGDYSFSQWYSLSDRREVNPDRLFDTSELEMLSAVLQKCKVTGIAEDCFLVETDEKSNLEKVYFDEYTKFVINGDPASYENVRVGNMLNVTYEKLYESYNPKFVIANKVDIIVK